MTRSFPHFHKIGPCITSRHSVELILLDGDARAKPVDRVSVTHAGNLTRPMFDNLGKWIRGLAPSTHTGATLQKL